MQNFSRFNSDCCHGQPTSHYRRFLC